MNTSHPSACTSTGSCAAYWTASNHESAPTARASSATRWTSTMVPTAFDDATQATTFTRSSSLRSRSSRSRRRSSVTSIHSSSKPLSAASSRHRDTPPSWSRRETRMRSPSFQSRDAVRESMKSSTVMFVPKTTSSGEQLRKRPASPRARSTMASTRRPVSYGAPRFPLASRSASAIAAPTSSGTCEPPGASRNAKPPRRDENRLRTAGTSSTVALMDRAYLGGIAVSRIVLGCGNFGGIGSAPELFGQGDSLEEAFAVMDAAWEAGITTFDTADAYGGGRSESFIGGGLGARRPEGIVLETKTFAPMDAGADHGLAPARVKRQVESSLGRLGVDRVDLFLTHAWDPEVPGAETAGALDDVLAEGKIGAYGCSNVDGEQLAEAVGVGAFRWVQNSYSLLDRDVERDVLPVCAERGLGFMPFSPLAGGWLTGKYRRAEAPPPGSRMTLRPGPYEAFWTEETFDRLERLAELGDPATLALGWLLAEP